MSRVYWQPGMKMSDVEKLVIESALLYTGGSYTRTGEMLGYTRATIRAKVDQYKIDLSILKDQVVSDQNKKEGAV